MEAAEHQGRGLFSFLFRWWASRPDGYFIRKIFALLVIACFAGVIADATGYLKEWEEQVDPSRLAPAPVDIERPEPGDNLRPYRPGMIPRPVPGRRARPRLPDGTLLPEPEGRMAFTFRASPEGASFIIASGRISAGTATEFKRFDEKYANAAKYVILLSHGGYVHEAVSLGRYLRERELITVVPSEGFCFSACPLVLAAGKERLVWPDSWVGLHQAYLAADSKPSPDKAFKAGQRAVADIMGYLEEHDVDPLVWRLAIRTPPDRIHMLSQKDLIDTRLATRVDDTAKLD